MKKLLAFAAMATMLCLIGLIMSGTAFADRCVDNGDGTVTENRTGLLWSLSPVDSSWEQCMEFFSMPAGRWV